MLKWILSWSAVTVAIPGTSNARHVTDNLAAALGAPLTPAQRERVGAYWQTLSR
jgi:aryl-alcohol dehydrogenase-like predicted oxidoreductase